MLDFVFAIGKKIVTLHGKLEAYMHGLNNVLFDVSENIKALNLSKIRGSIDGVLSRVPADVGGVYAWYRNFNPLLDTLSSQYYEVLLKEIYTKQFVSRVARMPPSYSIELHSDPFLSENKQNKLKDYCENEVFVSVLKEVFGVSLLFQSPLYIGKTNGFRRRFRDHLKGNTPLLERLNACGVDIRQCLLLYIQIDGMIDEEGPEVVIEDVLSRLFNPSFTKRYG